ncbi:OmpA family protein (plasmid) [Mycolicibacterium psychrotolerans]|uniref:OmpA family protein n=1 Tax=Mycolicibacterium psychrotolerans TaxID=216929 RepID=UPI003D67FD28
MISVHQGGSAPSIPAAAACYLDTALRTGEPVSIVTAEGAPRVIMKSATWTLNDGQPESANPQAYGDDLATARSAVLTAIHNASAASDHDDLLAALAMAADQAHQDDPAASVRILVIDDGLSDTGVINLAQPGMTAAEPDEVADFVRTHGGCPTSLTGVSVTMYGAGYGVDPQPALSTAQITRVGQIWQKTIEACGGHLDLVPSPRTDPGPATTHTVTPVPALPAAAMPLQPTGPDVVLNDDSALRFNPDSADLTDPAAAQALLTPIAKYLAEDAHHAVTVSGTTSNGPTAWPSYKTLSEARAHTVANILTSAGAPAAQITCRGDGYTANPPVTDPATAALNRTTRIHIDR